MSTFKKLRYNSGFTLIELLVVIAIIGILSSVVLASLDGARESSRDARRQTDLQQIKTGLALYRDNNGSFPSSLYGSTGNTLENSDAMTQVPVDPGNDNQYAYTTSTSNSGADFCLGTSLEASATPTDHSSDCLTDLKNNNTGGYNSSDLNYAISG